MIYFRNWLSCILLYVKITFNLLILASFILVLSLNNGITQDNSVENPQPILVFSNISNKFGFSLKSLKVNSLL